MSIGQLRYRCKFERNEPVDMPGGGQSDYYVEMLTTFGYLKSSQGSRTSEAGELLIYSSNTLICRFQQALINQIDSSVRVLVNNRFFTVVDYQLEDEKRYYYKFSLREIK